MVTATVASCCPRGITTLEGTLTIGASSGAHQSLPSLDSSRPTVTSASAEYSRLTVTEMVTGDLFGSLGTATCWKRLLSIAQRWRTFELELGSAGLGSAGWIAAENC